MFTGRSPGKPGRSDEGRVHLRTIDGGPEGEWMYSCSLFYFNVGANLNIYNALY